MSEADFARDEDDPLETESEYEYYSEEKKVAEVPEDADTGEEFGSDDDIFNTGAGGYVPTAVAKGKKQSSSTMPKKVKKKKKKTKSPERKL
jgi:hypothetical protein